MDAAPYIEPRTNWTEAEILQLFQLPFNDLLFLAQTVHRTHFDANEIQISTLLSIKTGGCQEDCKYCPQSAHFETPVKATKLLDVDEVTKQAKAAKDAGADRFCMGAAWRSPKDRDMPKLLAMIDSVKSLGLETCMTLGMLSDEQAQTLAEAGLDYYNHNIDSSEDFYHKIISTRTYQDRLDTLKAVQKSGMKTCCGGIIGMGESDTDRAGMIQTLATLAEHPTSVPINRLVQVEGTPLDKDTHNNNADDIDFVRTIAVARITMPKSYVRLSAGREEMSESCQALCFLAGANSIFYGDKLLTTSNPEAHSDIKLMEKLGINTAHSSCKSTKEAA